jgi:hypothetical protein
VAAETPRKGREGSRWFNERPSAKAFADWFATVPLHAGLKHQDFISGVTLIHQTEKVDEVVGWNGTDPVIAKRENLVYIPHPQVMARVAYFEALRTLHQDEWTCSIEPAAIAGDPTGLPPGYFRYAVMQGSGTQAFFVGCSRRLVIRDREGDLILDGPAGSKVVPVLKSNGWADPNALMRAESGALGRALGMAGMLVIPGSGVATAEDVQESIAQPVELPGVVVPAGSTAVPPAYTTSGAPDYRDRVEQLVAELATESPAELDMFDAWCKDRNIDLASPTDAELKTAVKKLEQVLLRIRSEKR